MFFAFILPLPVVHAADFTVEKIQKSYEGIKGLKGSFVQKSHIKDLKRTEVYNGSFVIKMPSLMRWEYAGDRKQETEVIINNNEIVIFKKNENQAYRGKFNMETYGRTPIALLSGLGNIEKEFNVSEKDDRLILMPRQSAGNVEYIELRPSEPCSVFPIGALSIIDTRSNRVDITISSVTINPAIKDSVFEFSLPKGASMYDYGLNR